MSIQDVRRAMQEFAARTGRELDIPPAVVAVVLDELGAATGLSEVKTRYLGKYNSLPQLARSLARQSFPPPAVGTLGGVDFDAWPFVHIDWDAAATTLGKSLQSGTLLVVDGTYYFDAA